MKKALVLNGSENEIPLIESAKRLGYYVITTGNNPSLVGHSYADEYINADYSDKEQIYELAKRLNIDILVPCANDFSVISAAYAAEKLGLGGHDSYETALILHEKNRYKEFGMAHGFDVIPSKSFYNADDAVLFAKNNDVFEYPLIIKPSDLSGGKGITKIDDAKQAEAAIKLAFGMTKRQSVVIEPFIEGPHFGYVALLVNKKVVADICINDMFHKNKFMVSHSFGHSALISDELMNYLRSELERMAGILNMADGEICIQFRLKDGKPHYVETMRRCLGNFPIMAISHIMGFSWYDFMLKTYAAADRNEYNIPKEISRSNRFAGYVCYMPQKNGILKKMWTEPELEKHFVFRIILAEPGHIVKDYKNEKLGYAVYSFDSYDEMFSYASHIYDFVHVEVDD